MAANVNLPAVRSLRPLHIPKDFERTQRWDTVVKVMTFGVLLGLGLMFASFWIGWGVAGVSLLTLGYTMTIDEIVGGHTKLQQAVLNKNDFKAKFLLFFGSETPTPWELHLCITQLLGKIPHY